MKTLQIKINSITDIYNLVAAARKVDGDVTITRGHHAVDAKSTPGVFSVDLSTGVNISFPMAATGFEKFITSFIKK